MSCPSPSATPRPSWGSFLSTIELVLYELFVFEPGFFIPSVTARYTAVTAATAGVR
jgi:hypothetical protein